MDKYRIDSHKLMYHPERVQAFLNAGDDWEQYKTLQPIYAEISTAGSCNHRCTFCSVDYLGYKRVFLRRAVLKGFFESAAQIGLQAVMFAGDGEPLLNPDIIDIVGDAFENGIETAFTTNAVPLKQRFVESSLHKVSWIKVSMNAGDAEAYAAIHQTAEKDFGRVWENLEFAVKHREDERLEVALGVQSLILPDNLHTLDDLVMRARSVGLDYVVLKPYVHNVYMLQEGYSHLDYTAKEYSETLSALKQKYDDDVFHVVARTNALMKLVVEQDSYSTCLSTPALWFYVSGNGDVYACGAHVGNSNFLLGNIHEDTIESIWMSDDRRNCWSFVQEELDLAVCRNNCRMDEANRYLEQLVDTPALNPSRGVDQPADSQILHRNFI
jgi:radical SAM protein with 4Fe4S-binding SPASM domain